MKSLRSTILVAAITLCPLILTAQKPYSPKPNPTADIIGELDSAISGSSSLFFIDSRMWSCNDHGDLTLYSIDTVTGATDSSLSLGVTINDMEEVAQDSLFLYFGDFGDNNGIRDDLRILRLPKTSLAADSLSFDTISFAYPERTADRATDYDCEAFIATDTALLLFTKQWQTLQSAVYSLPKQPGSYQATLIDTLHVNGLVTGASFHPHERLLTLCGYSMTCRPFVYLAYGFDSTGLFSGTTAQINLSNGIGTQTEGIATTDLLHYYLTSESFSLYSINNPARLLSLDLSEYLNSYFHPTDTTQIDTTHTDTTASDTTQIDTTHTDTTLFIHGSPVERVTIYPNPTTNLVNLPAGIVRHAEVFALSGRREMSVDASDVLDLSSLPSGTYTLRLTLQSGETVAVSVIKQ